MQVHFISSCHLQLGQVSITQILSELKPTLVCFESLPHSDKKEVESTQLIVEDQDGARLRKLVPATLGEPEEVEEFFQNVVLHLFKKYGHDLQACRDYAEENKLPLHYLEENMPELVEGAQDMLIMLMEQLYKLYQTDKNVNQIMSVFRLMLRLSSALGSCNVAAFGICRGFSNLPKNLDETMDKIMSNDRNVNMATNLNKILQSCKETDVIAVVTGDLHTTQLAEHFSKLSSVGYMIHKLEFPSDTDPTLTLTDITSPETLEYFRSRSDPNVKVQQFNPSQDRVPTESKLLFESPGIAGTDNCIIL